MDSDTRPLPTYSFLTSAYDTELFLEETIRSVRAQTSGDWELVVVDNGNSEKIAAIVRQYQHDPRIMLVRQENKGYTGGVMAAAQVARGDYFTVLDSDDQVLPNYLERMAAHLAAHPEVDAIGCDAWLVVDGRPSATRGYFESIETPVPPLAGRRLDLKDVLGGQVPYYSGVVSRRAWDSVGGYTPDVSDVEEDVFTWLRLASEFCVDLLPDKLARCRIRESSLSRNPASVEDFERRLIRTFEAFAHVTADPAMLDAVTPTLRRLRYHQALRRARASFLQGDVGSARRFARAAFRHRHSMRALIVWAGVTLVPGALAALHPLKQRLSLVRWRASPHTDS